MDKLRKGLCFLRNCNCVCTQFTSPPHRAEFITHNLSIGTHLHKMRLFRGLACEHESGVFPGVLEMDPGVFKSLALPQMP